MKKQKQKMIEREAYWAGKILESKKSYKKWLYDACKLDYDDEEL